VTTTPEVDALRRRYEGWPTEDLLRVVHAVGDFRPEAVQVAREILAARNVPVDGATAEVVIAEVAEESAAAKRRHQGVGGWLLLFCVGLTVIGPLVTLGSLTMSYNESSQYFDQFPGLLLITVIDTLLSLGLMAFSIYAGTGLWSIRPGAVHIAKRFLLCVLGYCAVAALLPFMAGLPSEAHEAMTAQIAKNMFRAVIYVAVWYSYLNRSKRVSATYHL